MSRIHKVPAAEGAKVKMIKAVGGFKAKAGETGTVTKTGYFTESEYSIAFVHITMESGEVVYPMGSDIFHHYFKKL